jgi:hypothetical protein
MTIWKNNADYLSLMPTTEIRNLQKQLDILEAAEEEEAETSG